MEEPPHILIVEDDADVIQGLDRGLRQVDLDESSAQRAQGLELIMAQHFDLILLDLMLPKSTGFDVLKTLETRASVPVIVLSALSDLPARLKSFELGAVDFVAKPFFIEEIIARIRTRLKLRVVDTPRVIHLADTIIDVDARRVLRNGKDLALTSYEFNVLMFLCLRSGRAQTRSQIAQSALSEDELF